jgi:hypothetical protein
VYCRNISSDRNLAKGAGEPERGGGSGPGERGEHGGTQQRELSDPQAIRAMTHPVRLALLEALELHGPLTATQAGELIGEPPNTCSFHFRQLAKYGFVEEAGPAPGRSRPWRLTTVQMHVTDQHDSPEAAIAARELSRMLRERYFSRMTQFHAHRSQYPRAWQEVTGESQALVHVTPDELRELGEQIVTLLNRYIGRNVDPAKRPAGSLPVEVLWFGYPIRLPEE